jgi:hypothetical protein
LTEIFEKKLGSDHKKKTVRRPEVAGGLRSPLVCVSFSWQPKKARWRPQWARGLAFGRGKIRALVVTASLPTVPSRFLSARADSTQKAKPSIRAKPEKKIKKTRNFVVNGSSWFNTP